MRRAIKSWLLGLLSFGLIATFDGVAQDSAIPGVWRGTSTCTVANSPCHDEVDVYRIAAMAGKPGWFSVSADKIVNGQEVEMGSGDWRFNPKTQALNYEFDRGVFNLTLSGKHLDGTLKLPDGTLYRRIHLEKEL